MRIIDERAPGFRVGWWKIVRPAIAAGEIVLHVWQPLPIHMVRAPLIFRREADAGRPWAHLMGSDAEKLKALARKFGVRSVMVHGHGAGMHVDLCGKPLERALAEAEGE